MVEITLTSNKVALVDLPDFYNLTKHKWFYTKIGYAARDIRVNGKKVRLYMHREIMKAKKGEFVDHKDCNPLNNTRENLRICTKAENQRNCKMRKNNTSGQKGVIFLKRDKKWRAQIGITQNGKRKTVCIGLFDDKEVAIRVYRESAPKYHGEFVRV